MQDADRKLAWAAVLAMAAIAGELGWIIATGHPTHGHGSYANASQESAEENPWRWLISAVFWNAVFAGLLTVFNVGLWRQTRNLAQLTRESIDNADAASAQQTKDMQASVAAMILAGDATREVARETSEIAMHMSVAAEAMQEVARQTEELGAVQFESAKRQLRAYVHVAGARVFNLNREFKRGIVVEIKNYGQTPALNCRFRAIEHVREWPLESVLVDPDESLPAGVEPLPPGRVSIQKLPVGELSEFEERTLRNYQAGVYVWGMITYEDIFGKKHFTRVRFVCEGEGLESGAMHATEQGNECD